MNIILSILRKSLMIWDTALVLPSCESIVSIHSTFPEWLNIDPSFYMSCKAVAVLPQRTFESWGEIPAASYEQLEGACHTLNFIGNKLFKLLKLRGDSHT